MISIAEAFEFIQFQANPYSLADFRISLSPSKKFDGKSTFVR